VVFGILWVSLDVTEVVFGILGVVFGILGVGFGIRVKTSTLKTALLQPRVRLPRRLAVVQRSASGVQGSWFIKAQGAGFNFKDSGVRVWG
jgi:hypothetical protein